MESRLDELEQKITQISEFFNEINTLQIKRNEISNQTIIYLSKKLIRENGFQK